jgi:hypothetical protein
VFDATGNRLDSFLAFAPTFTGGVNVAALSRPGGPGAIVTGAGAGGGPQVSIFDGLSLQLLSTFFAYTPTFTGGVFVSAGLNNGLATIITGAGVGGGPQVNVFDAATLRLLSSFFATMPSFTGGVRVAAQDIFGDGQLDVLTTYGHGAAPTALTFNLAGQALDSFYAFDPAFTGGAFLASALQK